MYSNEIQATVASVCFANMVCLESPLVYMELLWVRGAGLCPSEDLAAHIQRLSSLSSFEPFYVVGASSFSFFFVCVSLFQVTFLFVT